MPLALVGGPLQQGDYDLLDWIERAGGRIALDASESGERTLPRPFDAERTAGDPLGELADAYFGIPDVFRRPTIRVMNTSSRDRRPAGSRRGVPPLCVVRPVARGTAAAEGGSPVPVVDLDVAESEASAEGRTLGRIEAFLEMLRRIERPTAQRITLAQWDRAVTLESLQCRGALPEPSLRRAAPPPRRRRRPAACEAPHGQLGGRAAAVEFPLVGRRPLAPGPRPGEEDRRHDEGPRHRAGDGLRAGRTSSPSTPTGRGGFPA